MPVQVESTESSLRYGARIDRTGPSDRELPGSREEGGNEAASEARPFPPRGLASAAVGYLFFRMGMPVLVVSTT